MEAVRTRQRDVVAQLLELRAKPGIKNVAGRDWVAESSGYDLISGKSPGGSPAGGAVKNATANLHGLTAAPPSLGDALGKDANRRSETRISVAWTVGAVTRSFDSPRVLKDKKR